MNLDKRPKTKNRSSLKKNTSQQHSNSSAHTPSNKTIIRNQSPHWTDKTISDDLETTQNNLSFYEEPEQDITQIVLPSDEPSSTSKETSHIHPFTKIDTGIQIQTVSRQKALEAILNELPEGDETEALKEEAPLTTTQEDENTMKKMIDFLIKENPVVKSKKRSPILAPAMRQQGVIPLWEQLSFRANANQMTNIDKSLMLADIRRGLEAREFVYLYQPQWHLETGRIDTLESSLRWRHPRKGMLGPDFFFAIFEESGLIGDLLALLTEQILIDRLQLELNGLKDFKIAIKFTPDQLKLHLLSDNLIYLLNKMNVRPEFIECELTDRQFPRCPRSMRDNLETLHQAGVNLVLDNFGSGYSGYPYLLEFPFNKIKLDKSYVTNIFQNPRGQLIAQSVIHMAHLLHAEAVIDGIDDIQMIRWLINAGCDYGQGCFLGGPMALEDLIDFLKDYRIIANNGKPAIEKFWQEHAKQASRFSPDC